MLKTRPFTPVILAAFVSITIFPAVASASPWQPVLVNTPNSTALVVQDTYMTSGEQASYLVAQTGSNSYTTLNQTACTGDSSSGPCNFDAPGVTVIGTIELPVCTSALQSNCVAGLSIGTSADGLAPATFVQMTAGPILPPDSARGLPDGSTVGLWTSSVPNEAGTNTYATVVSMTVTYSGGHYRFDNFVANVLPYAMTSGVFQTPTINQNATASGTRVGIQGATPNCAWTGPNECAQIQDFIPGTVASLSIRVTNEIGGWFVGRLQDPSLSVAPFDSSSNLITVSGSTVEAPQLAVTIPDSNPVLDTIFPNIASYWSDANNYRELMLPAQGALAAVDALRTFANNTASGQISEWTFESFNATGDTCMTDTSHVLGLVTTNAMTYSDSAPTFANGQLTYQVAGMHYLPDGSLALGTYDMVMADSVARCLYHFSTAPISGSVSVTESNGTENVATTSVTDRGGWLHLAAYSFTFSNPVISMKLTQAVAKKSTKKITISCVRGKLVKRVSGTKPVCPTGYKKR
ncbi:MAG: hypothetical protein HIU84_14085 [Acidobacteria bacterium]|nr:hypothetical protein [Acidobacteriota bacterium]